MPLGCAPHWNQSAIQSSRERETGTRNYELFADQRVWNRLQHRLHADIRKPASRLRDASEHEVPELRIVPNQLWQAEKARQGMHDVNRAERPATDPKGLSQSQGIYKLKYLLSGLLCCCGVLTIAGSGDRRYHCSNSKQKGPAVCEGQPGIRQEEAKQRVLAGLQRHQLTDATYAAFKARVDTEAAALAERANAEIRWAESQVAQARDTVDNLAAAIAKGRTSRALFSAQEKAEDQLAILEAKRAGLMPVVVELPGNLPQVYRAQTRRLASPRRSRTKRHSAGRASRGGVSSTTVVVSWAQATESHKVAIDERLGALLELSGAPGRSISRPPTTQPSRRPRRPLSTPGRHLAASRILTAPMMSRMAFVRCWEPASQGQGANHRPCTVTLIEGLASMLASVSCQDSHAQQGE